MQSPSVVDIMNVLLPFVVLASISILMYVVRQLRLISSAISVIFTVLGIDKDVSDVVDKGADFVGRVALGRAGGEAVSAVISDSVITEGTQTFPAFIKFVLTLLGGQFHGNDVAFMEWLVTNVPKYNLTQSVLVDIDKAQLEDLQNMKQMLDETRQRIEEKEAELKQKLEPPQPEEEKPPLKEGPKGGKK